MKYIYFCPFCKECGVAEHENPMEEQRCHCGEKTVYTGCTLEQWNRLSPEEQRVVHETGRLPQEGARNNSFAPAPAAESAFRRTPAAPAFQSNAVRNAPAAAPARTPAPVQEKASVIGIVFAVIGVIALLCTIGSAICYYDRYSTLYGLQVEDFEDLMEVLWEVFSEYGAHFLGSLVLIAVGCTAKKHK